MPEIPTLPRQWSGREAGLDGIGHCAAKRCELPQGLHASSGCLDILGSPYEAPTVSSTGARFTSASFTPGDNQGVIRNTICTSARWNLVIHPWTFGRPCETTAAAALARTRGTSPSRSCSPVSSSSTSSKPLNLFLRSMFLGRIVLTELNERNHEFAESEPSECHDSELPHWSLRKYCGAHPLPPLPDPLPLPLGWFGWWVLGAG